LELRSTRHLPWRGAGRAIGRSQRRARRWAPRAAALGLGIAGLMAVAGCDNQFTRLGMPIPATRQAKMVLTLWQGSWIAAFAVGFVVWGLIIWAVIFHRKRSEELPPQVRYNLPIEVLYTALPFVVIAVLFYFTAKDENAENKLSARPDVVVNVTGFQWSWKFDYPQYPVPGTAAGDVQIIGQPADLNLAYNANNPAASGPQFVIPEGKTVRFNLVSTDVIHSFWVPAFLFHRDVIPGHPNHFEITPTSLGTFTGRCAELCGEYHSEMIFTVKVVTPQQFQKFITAKKAAALKSGGSAQ
jgi:cytochrome c oxidase subunit II